MMLHVINVTQCADRALQTLVVGGTNSISRWIGQRQSVIIFMKIVYIQEIKKNLSLYLTN
jgi:hypothetical protein